MNHRVGKGALRRVREWVERPPAWARLAGVLGAVGLGALAWGLKGTGVGLVPLVVVTVVALEAMDGERWKRWAKYHRTGDFFLSVACIGLVAGIWAGDLTGRPITHNPATAALLCAIACLVSWRRWVRRLRSR